MLEVFTTLEYRKKELFVKINKLIDIASCHGIDVPAFGITYTLKGTAAGKACFRNNKYSVNFNTRMMLENWDHIYNDTIPHELAHIICMHNPSLGNNHNAGWKRMCIFLGGSGEIYHSEEVVYAKGKTFEYTSQLGQIIRLSQTRHKRVQSGVNYSIRSDGKIDSIHSGCSYKVV